MEPRTLDVAIVGGGLAGNLLARQLRRELPDLRVAIFEQSTSTSYKVGEAVVEIASNYLVRKLGLIGYLYERQLPKNGLRYFFDNENRDAELHEMSEMGSVNLPFHPAFQLDRAQMETDLLDMNRRSGIQVRTGATVKAIELGTGGDAHCFSVSDEHGDSAWSTRWLIDAAGRRGLLAKQMDLRVPEEEHRIGSVWGRFEGVQDVDDVGPAEFRSRVRHTARRLSTIHFWYPGYWIWFIPLRGGVTSIGVTGELVSRSRDMRTPEGFRAFLDEHRAVASLLEGAKNLDVGSLARIAYGTKRFFHPDRWGLIGEAATAADPLYSPGTDFIALENDFLTDLIVRDADGGDPEDLAERFRLYDAFMEFRHQAALRLYRGLYDTFGSYELACAKWDFDIGCYYNLWVSSYMRDQHLDPNYLREQLRLEPMVLGILDAFTDLFRKVEAHLREEGHYSRGNLGRFYYGLNNIGFDREIGSDRSQAQVLTQAVETFNVVRAQALELLGEAPSRADVEPLSLADYVSARALV